MLLLVCIFVLSDCNIAEAYDCTHTIPGVNKTLIIVEGRLVNLLDLYVINYVFVIVGICNVA